MAWMVTFWPLVAGGSVAVYVVELAPPRLTPPKNSSVAPAPV